MTKIKIPRKDLEYNLHSRYGRQFSFIHMKQWYPTIREAVKAYYKFPFVGEDEDDLEKKIRLNVFDTRQARAKYGRIDPGTGKVLRGFEDIHIRDAIEYKD
jgi:hypothetical protein